jgi:curli biogenesis system outer membrane secretion channel CsgG
MRRSYFLIFLIAYLTGVLPAHGFLGKALKKEPESEAGTSEVVLPEYKGIKHAITVTDFDNQQSWRAQIELGNALAAMLESALFESGRFVIVERADLGDVFMEQDLQASGRAAESSQTAQTGLVRSAKYLATGDITRVTDGSQGTGGGIGIKGFRIGIGGSKSEVELVVKLIDTTSSTVVGSKRITGIAGGSKLRLGYSGSGFSGDLGGFAKTPLGEAAQDAISTAVEFIATEMEDYDITANVVLARSKDMIVINRGEDYGVSVGDQFLIREAGEVLTDPATGEILDVFEGTVTGKISVNRVSEKVSYAKLVEGSLPLRGDAVVFEDSTM